MKIGSQSIGKLTAAITRLDSGNGVEMSYERLLEESGIATAVTLAKAIREAKQAGRITVSSGSPRGRGAGRQGRWPNRYRVIDL